jgi:hypothetical protein
MHDPAHVSKRGLVTQSQSFHPLMLVTVSRLNAQETAIAGSNPIVP